MDTNVTTATTSALLTATELCDYLKCGTSTAYKLLNMEGFPTVKISRRKYAYKEGVDEWLRKLSATGEEGVRA